MVKLISREWNAHLEKYENTYLADSERDVTADCGEGCAEGSTILCVGNATAYIKNTQGKWQKLGSEEVIS